MSAGKGDAPRPMGMSREEYGRKFDAIFRPPQTDRSCRHRLTKDVGWARECLSCGRKF